MAAKRSNSQVYKSPSESIAPTKRITRLNMPSCKVCDQLVSLEFKGDDSVSVLCRICNDRYHANCVGISSDFVYKLIQNSRKGWLCYSCSQDSFKFMNKLDERLKTVETRVAHNSQQIQQVNSTCDSAFKALDEKMGSIQDQFAQEIANLREQQQFGSSGHVEMNEIVNQARDQVLQSINNDSVKASNEADLKYIRNLQRKNNLVIGNIPIDPHESQDTLKQIVLRIAHALGVNLQLQQIVIVIRLNKKENQSSSAVLVKFIDVVNKQEVFDAYIQRVFNKNPISLLSIGINSAQRIYINHHISPQLAEIKRKALELKKGNVIAKVNARYNNIRVFVNNKWHNIETMAELEGVVNNDLLH